MPRLPIWPLAAMFGLVPLWWLLGAFYLGWPVLGMVLLAILVHRGKVELPSGTGWWLAFMALATLSVLRLEAASELLTFTLRMSFYGSALVVCLYVYNLLREGNSWQDVFRPLMLFWLALVGLGWLGVLMPHLDFVSGLERVLPAGVANVPYINDLIHGHSAEYNAASLNPIFRPAAPFAYTNNWGSAFALLVPCVIGYVYSVRTGPLRTVLLISLPLALPPAFYTLNRGMFLSLGVGLLVLSIKALMRGRALMIASVASIGAVFWAATLVIPVSALIAQRVDSSDTTKDRLGLYYEALNLARQSPLLGFGRPTSVDTVTADAPVGTQGQLWLVLISHGLPALIAFAGWLIVVMRGSLRGTTPAGEWLALVPLIALVQMPFYGLTYQNLAVVFYAVGLSYGLLNGPLPARLRPRVVDVDAPSVFLPVSQRTPAGAR